MGLLSLHIIAPYFMGLPGQFFTSGNIFGLAINNPIEVSFLSFFILSVLFILILLCIRSYELNNIFKRLNREHFLSIKKERLGFNLHYPIKLHNPLRLIIRLTHLMSRKKERREIETLHDPHPMKLSHAGNKAVCVQGNQATGTKLIFSTCHEIEVPIESNFLIKVDTIITRHLNDADFKVNDLSRALHISRTQLHRKMKAATNKSTSHVVRSLRLCKARNLLFSTNLKVTEVAYDTGFKDPNHFSRVFKQEFGISPSKIRKAKILNSA